MDLDATLSALYSVSYGVHRYLFPLFELTILNTSAVIIVLSRAGFHMVTPDIQQVLEKIPDASLAGLAGALLWGMFDSVQRFETIDLSPASLHYLALRLLLAPVI